MRFVMCLVTHVMRHISNARNLKYNKIYGKERT